MDAENLHTNLPPFVKLCAVSFSSTAQLELEGGVAVALDLARSSVIDYCEDMTCDIELAESQPSKRYVSSTSATISDLSVSTEILTRQSLILIDTTSSQCQGHSTLVRMC